MMHVVALQEHNYYRLVLLTQTPSSDNILYICNECLILDNIKTGSDIKTLNISQNLWPQMPKYVICLKEVNDEKLMTRCKIVITYGVIVHILHRVLYFR